MRRAVLVTKPREVVDLHGGEDVPAGELANRAVEFVHRRQAREGIGTGDVPGLPGGADEEQEPGRREVYVGGPAGTDAVQREKRGDERPGRSDGQRVPVPQEPRQDETQRHDEGEQRELGQGRQRAEIGVDDGSLERCRQRRQAWMLQQRDERRLHDRDAEQQCAPPRGGMCLSEPDDHGQVEREQQRHRVDDRAATDIDERAVGEREDDDADDEPTALRGEPEQRARTEDQQRCCVHGGRHGVREGPRQRQRGGDRQQYSGCDE
jgi:hypothetical protein